MHTYTHPQPHRAGFVPAPLLPHFFSKGRFSLTWRCVWWLTPCWAATGVSSLRALAAIFRGMCMALAQLIRRGGDMSSATRKNGCKEGINMPHSLTNYSSSPSDSFMKEITGLLSLPKVHVLLLSIHGLSSPFWFQSLLPALRALLLPPVSQLLTHISSAPAPCSPCTLTDIFIIPAVSPLISTLLYTSSRVLPF